MYYSAFKSICSKRFKALVKVPALLNSSPSYWWGCEVLWEIIEKLQIVWWARRTGYPKRSEQAQAVVLHGFGMSLSCTSFCFCSILQQNNHSISAVSTYTDTEVLHVSFAFQHLSVFQLHDTWKWIAVPACIISLGICFSTPFCIESILLLEALHHPRRLTKKRK